MNKQNVTGIILAGGASKRMGNDKGLCEFRGRQLVKYAIDLLTPICDTIIISSNNIDGYKHFGYDIITDKFANTGPIGGIYSGLVKSDTEHNLVISCDTPFLSIELLEFVYSKALGYDIVVPEHGNSLVEPLAAYYSKNVIGQIENSINERDYKLLNLFKKVRFLSAKIDMQPWFSKKIFTNLNTPDELLSC